MIHSTLTYAIKLFKVIKRVNSGNNSKCYFRRGEGLTESQSFCRHMIIKGNNGQHVHFSPHNFMDSTQNRYSETYFVSVTIETEMYIMYIQARPSVSSSDLLVQLLHCCFDPGYRVRGELLTQETDLCLPHLPPLTQ